MGSTNLICWSISPLITKVRLNSLQYLINLYTDYYGPNSKLGCMSHHSHWLLRWLARDRSRPVKGLDLLTSSKQKIPEDFNYNGLVLHKKIQMDSSHTCKWLLRAQTAHLVHSWTVDHITSWVWRSPTWKETVSQSKLKTCSGFELYTSIGPLT
jgi:hypothetical protein